MEIENEIKERNIVDSYDRREGSLQPRFTSEINTPFIEEGFITQLRNSSSVEDLKANSKRLKK
jgi:hypothetical protein